MHSFEIRAPESVAEVDELLRLLYGPVPPVPSGVVHVVAAWLDPDRGRLEVLRPGVGTATSVVDGMVLALARARADAIVTTGAVLRAEPDLVHDLSPAGRAAEAIAAWRRRRLDRVSSPVTALLTRGDGLDRSHPLLRSTQGVMVYTTVAGALGLDGRAPATSLVVGVRRPGLRELIVFLENVASPFLPAMPRTILVEAGPSTASALYEPPLVVDELLLSILERPRPDAAACAGRLPDIDHLRRLLPVGSAELRVDEAGSSWRFLRMARPRTGAVQSTPPDGQGRTPRV